MKHSLKMKTWKRVSGLKKKKSPSNKSRTSVGLNTERGIS